MKQLVFTGLCFMQSVLAASAALQVRSLTCEHVAAPLGIETAQPRFSWKLDSNENGQAQTAYQILEADSPEQLTGDTGNLWDSGWVVSPSCRLISYAGSPLASLQNCWWKVRVKDRDGKISNWSAPARFATGLLAGEAPAGQWISNPSADFKTGTSWFRKTVQLKTAPRQALVMLASRGYHEFYVNGKKVDNRAMAPNASMMKKRTLYVVYDIAPLLQAGENTLAVWIAPPSTIVPRVDPAFLLQAKVDGQVLISDASWKTKISSVSRYYSDIPKPFFGGEKCVETDELRTWSDGSVDVAAWGNASVREENTLLSSDLTPPMRHLGVIQAKTVERRADGKVLVDFGEYFTGQIEASVAGTPQQPILFRSLMSDLGNPQDLGQISVYVPDQTGRGVFRQHFNWVGGRWMEISGLTELPKLEELKINRIGTDLQRIGFFSCSDALLNQIYETDLHTFKSCTLNGYTMDCTTRERTGYGEEAFATSRGCGLGNYDVTAFLRGWLQIWRDGQKEDGYMPHTAPAKSVGGGTLWSSFTVLDPWDLWLASGDKTVLEENYPSAKSWLDYLHSKVTNGILQRYESTAKFDFLGDWARPVPPESRGGRDKHVKNFGDSPLALFFNNGIYVLNLMTLERSARVLGKSEDERRWQGRLAALREGNHKRFFDPAAGTYIESNQVLSSLALLTGITPSVDNEKTQGALVAEMQKKNYLDAGSSGLPVFLQFLTDNPQYHDWLYRVLSRREYPGYGYFLAQGYNTWPELWDPTCSSKTHTCYTGISFWFIRALAGVQPLPEAPGYERFIVKPSFVKGLDRVSYEFDSPRGWIKVKWERKGGEVVLDLTVPPGASAEVQLPSGIQAAGSGSHQYRFVLGNS